MVIIHIKSTTSIKIKSKTDTCFIGHERECEVFQEKLERKVRLVILVSLDREESLEFPALEETL
jgi:hypothetical protein